LSTPILNSAALSTGFLIGACVIAVAAAAPLMMALLGRAAPEESERDAERARAALATARAAGVLSQEEYDNKLAMLPARTASTNSPVASLLAIALAIALPLSALGIYAWIGEPRALDPAQHIASTNTESDIQAPDMAVALAKLEAELEANPDDADRWSLLARGYQTTQQFDKAVGAMRKVRALMPGNLDADAGYAEALALASPGRRIDGEAAEILQTILQRDPEHQRALWLSGIAGMQRGDSAAALKHWRALEALLPEGSDIRASLAQQIASAEAGGPAADADASTDNASESTEVATGAVDPSTASGSISVSISLDPKLKDQVAPGDTLFVFARAANGPRMPLAIQRLSASQLPLMITLDDSMSMMPEMKLSKFPEIIIGARISKSGNATATSGDLQASTQPINQAAIKDRVQITIDEVVQ
jgi:cytochrome c-type biogenesis protein CcmH